MRYRHQLAAVMAGIVILVFGCSDRDKRDSGPDRGEEPKVQTIPLDSVYSTNGQEKLKPVSRRLEEPYGMDLEELYRNSQGMGASNIFLVRGDDLAAAVKATRRVFTGYRSADVPVNPEDQANAAQVWLVAYLGTAGSGPPAWLVDSVEVKEQTVTLTISKPKRFYTTNLVHQYFVWVPLGKLGAGTYALELMDAGKKEVSLLRRVTVSEK